MKEFGKSLILSVMGLVSLYTGIVACYWIAEHYFFDKLFYQKSTAHGYYSPDASIRDYGERSSDLADLRMYANIHWADPVSAVLGKATDTVFTVAVIGDSFVWGQGVRTEERFAEILEKKLQEVRPSNVIVLANPGDDFFDYYVHYRDIQRKEPDIDLYIFALVENDVLFNNYSEDEDLKTRLVASCPYNIIYNARGGEHAPSLYRRLLEGAYDPTTGNLCLFRALLPLFPSANAIYFDTQYDKSNAYIQGYIRPLLDRGLHVVTRDYLNLISPERYVVSRAESHPSRYAHRLFADILFHEIESMGFLSQ